MTATGRRDECRRARNIDVRAERERSRSPPRFRGHRVTEDVYCDVRDLNAFGDRGTLAVAGTSFAIRKGEIRGCRRRFGQRAETARGNAGGATRAGQRFDLGRRSPVSSEPFGNAPLRCVPVDGRAARQRLRPLPFGRGEPGAAAIRPTADCLARVVAPSRAAALGRRAHRSLSASERRRRSRGSTLSRAETSSARYWRESFRKTCGCWSFKTHASAWMPPRHRKYGGRSARAQPGCCGAAHQRGSR